MEFLKANLGNSFVLPYDMMRLIYEYATPPYLKELQTTNIKELLDDKMYKRMKKYLLSRRPYINYILFDKERNRIHITDENIDDINLKHNIIYDEHGYKSFYQWKVRRGWVCGIDFFTNYELHKCLQFHNPNKMIDMTNTKKLFEEWKKL